MTLTVVRKVKTVKAKRNNDMPKMKTHKGAKNRFKRTGSGKIVRMKGPRSHLRRKKSNRVKRLFGSTVPLDSHALSKRIDRLIG